MPSSRDFDRHSYPPLQANLARIVVAFWLGIDRLVKRIGTVGEVGPLADLGELFPEQLR